MLTSGGGPEEVWRRIKRWAFKAGNSDNAMPSEDRCRKEVRRIAFEVLGMMPEDAIDFYTAEACWMVQELRKGRSLT